MYLVLHPLRIGSNSKKYGPYDGVSEFEETVLKDPYFVREYLRPDDLRVLEDRAGTLEPFQVYYPVPYPFMGGSGDLATYDKGNIWIFADIAGQSHGIE